MVTVITSPKVSLLKTDVITPSSSLHCSMESGSVAVVETLDGSAFPCKLAISQDVERSPSISDQQVTQEFGDTFPETSRRSKVKNAEGKCRRNRGEDERKLPKLPLYGRL